MNQKKYRGIRLTLQCHITHECDLRCKHCYLFDSPTYDTIEAQLLPREAWFQTIDDLVLTAQRWGMSPFLIITGGDPILNPDFFNILRHAQGRGMAPYIMGNPYHIDEQIAQELAKCGVSLYQVSLDGLAGTHDRLRRKGSFAASIQALKTLQDAGIQTVVMFTLSRSNCDELLDVMRLVAEINVSCFVFDLLTPTGRGASLRDQILAPEELHALFAQVDALGAELTRQGATTFWNRKSSLWKLWEYEQGEFNSDYLASAHTNQECLGGCAVGGGYLVVQSNGLVVPCARLPIAIGQLPQDTISHILVNAPLLSQSRRLANYEKCSSCPISVTCRGCPAHSYNLTGDPFGPDPYCWFEPPLSSSTLADTSGSPAQESEYLSIREEALMDKPASQPSRQPAASSYPDRPTPSTTEPLLVGQFGFTLHEQAQLSARSFAWRKLIETGSHPHLRHDMFASGEPADPLADTMSAVPHTVRVSRLLQDSSTSLPPVFYLLIEKRKAAPDLRSLLQVLSDSQYLQNALAVGVQVPIRSLTAVDVGVLLKQDLELVLEFQWPLDFAAKEGNSSLSLPEKHLNWLNSLLYNYAGRSTARLVGEPEDGIAAIQTLLAYGFRSLDIPCLLTSPSLTRNGLHQIDELIGLVMERWEHGLFLDWVPLTNTLRWLHHQPSLPDADALPQSSMLCQDCWTQPICSREHQQETPPLACRRRQHFFAQAASCYRTLSAHEPAMLHMVCHSSRGLLPTDAEFQAALDNANLFMEG